MNQVFNHLAQDFDLLVVVYCDLRFHCLTNLQYINLNQNFICLFPIELELLKDCLKVRYYFHQLGN